VRRVVISQQITQELVRNLIPRAAINIAEASDATAEIIAEVRNSGVAALKEHSAKFDGVIPENFKVPRAALQKALRELDPQLKIAIETAIERVKKVSEAGLPKEFSVELANGAFVHQRYHPVDSVGLYVPGGKAVYPSSVVMNAIAALVAKVPRIAIASPAQKEFGGLPHPSILATAELLGITEVYAIGGASAVAAFAYGVSEIGLEPVRMVTGPGNIYVATAKRLLRSEIGIDSEAGPSEILIIADGAANPRIVAADLISQAEHDENAAAVLVTDSDLLISSVEAELALLSKNTANTDRVMTALSGQQSALVLVPDLDAAIEVSNHYATEHLEIMTSDPLAVLSKISNAGAIFLGPYSPVSLGDYLAGSNHVLPTGEQAKFGPGLGVHSFLRPQQIVDYSSSALKQVANQISVFAENEGLPAHGEAVQIRFEKEN
jgi:histidinol dehydrogenase